MKLSYPALLCAISTTSMLLAETLPVSRTITDVQGRSLDGTILAKMGETILFKRTIGEQTFKIKIDSLSTEDQKFIATLSEKVEGKVFQVMDPGNKVILAIPFEEQERGGLCAAASILNVLKFLDPELNIKQVEMLALCNDKRSGASPDEVRLGLNSLGYQGNLYQLRDADQTELTQRIKENLDQSRPVLIANRNHATVLFGYDNTKNIFYTWNHRVPNRRNTIEGFPDGTEEISQVGGLSQMVYVMYIEPARETRTMGMAREISDLRKTMDIKAYTILNANPSKESDFIFISRAASYAILPHLRRGNRVFFTPNLTQYYEIIQITEKEWQVRNLKTLEKSVMDRSKTIYLYHGQFIVASPK